MRVFYTVMNNTYLTKGDDLSIVGKHTIAISTVESIDYKNYWIILISPERGEGSLLQE